MVRASEAWRVYLHRGSPAMVFAFDFFSLESSEALSFEAGLPTSLHTGRGSLAVGVRCRTPNDPCLFFRSSLPCWCPIGVLIPPSGSGRGSAGNRVIITRVSRLLH